MIAEENYKADYKPNVTGMIVGGSLTGVGIFLLGTGIYAISSMPNEPGFINDAAGGFLGTFVFLAQYLFLALEFLFCRTIFINIRFEKNMLLNVTNIKMH